MNRAVRHISGVAEGHFCNDAEKLTGRLLAELQFSTIDEIFEVGLHQYLDEAQIKLNNIGAALFNAYIFQPFQNPDGEHMVQQEEQQQQLRKSKFMKRIGILTAGGDTPALNATIHGAVTRANQLKVEIFGLIKGFNCLFNPRVPHVHLNPLFQEIPELDPTKGGTLIGSSRDYVDPNKKDELDHRRGAPEKTGHRRTHLHRRRRHVERLATAGRTIAVVLAPKTIDNDLGLNYPSEPDEWVRVNDASAKARLQLQAHGVERRFQS